MTEDLLIIEDKKMRLLRLIVDLARATLLQSALTFHESQEMVENTKKSALHLFPEKGSVYDLIYTPRFRRIIDERFPDREPPAGRFAADAFEELFSAGDDFFIQR